ncbi:hypothetical protein PoB_003153000 [Plakobranchus ocellatus]|uniref:Uncharacterized protein n=1 Tax=Plakobranchus ocellatus TaxID=259542 RepID=A0AAV4AE34_9GAST|nr:hypothetical protein PoB_003153000 [Plakobranchus ocellatus]
MQQRYRSHHATKRRERQAVTPKVKERQCHVERCEINSRAWRRVTCVYRAKLGISNNIAPLDALACRETRFCHLGLRWPRLLPRH